MQRRSLLITLILVLGAGLAAGAVIMRQSAQTSKVREKKEKTIKIVVMTKNLTRGVKLKMSDLKLREWPERLATGNYIRSLKEAEGKIFNEFPPVKIWHVFCSYFIGFDWKED